MNATKRIANLSNNSRYSLFTIGDLCIKFKTSPYLEHYVSITKWNNGYIECLAKYSTFSDPIEEYIDLKPIAKRLGLDLNIFKSIKEVKII